MANITLFSAVASALTKAAPANLQNVNDRGWFRILESYAGAWQENVEVSLDGVLRHPTVFSCVTLIAFDIGKLNIRLVEEVEPDVWSEFESPAFTPVLRKPNAYQETLQFYMSWMISKLIHGNTYVLKQRDNRGGEFQGTVVAEYVLDPNRIRTLVAPDGSVWYEVKKDSLSRVPEDRTGIFAIPASEIIHDTYAPIYHPLVGVSPIHAIGVSATQALHIQSNAANFYANSAMPGGTVTVPGEITQDIADTLKTAWETNYGGSNAGRVAVLSHGMVYQPLKMMAATDAQVVEQLKWADEKICSVYHVPGFKVGVGPFPPYNSSVELNNDYYSTGVQVHLKAIETLQDRALGLSDRRIKGRRVGTQFDISGLIEMDQAKQIAAESAAVQGSLKTINEARRILNLPSVSGGDTIWAQEQDHSIEALAERDRNDPFAKPALPPAPEPPDDEDEDDGDDAEKRLTLLAKSLEIANRYARVA